MGGSIPIHPCITLSPFFLTYPSFNQTANPSTSPSIHPSTYSLARPPTHPPMELSRPRTQSFHQKHVNNYPLPFHSHPPSSTQPQPSPLTPPNPLRPAHSLHSDLRWRSRIRLQHARTLMVWPIVSPHSHARRRANKQTNKNARKKIK